jgi:hypothetical protein
MEYIIYSTFSSWGNSVMGYTIYSTFFTGKKCYGIYIIDSTLYIPFFSYKKIIIEYITQFSLNNIVSLLFFIKRKIMEFISCFHGKIYCYGVY